MSIVSIIAQPTTNSISAAYRPVVLRVKAKRTDDDPVPPVVFCDIYFNDTYYATIRKTRYSKLNETDSEWQFDIQDAAQTVLKKAIGAYGEKYIVEMPTLVVKCFCKFRSSGYEGGSGLEGPGYIVSEDEAPVQGTNDTPPVSGTGTQGNTFYIVNSTLQHKDNQDLLIHLLHHKVNGEWSADCSPLSHRPNNYRIAPNDSDVFPIIYRGSNQFKKLSLFFKNCNQNTFNQLDLNILPTPNCDVIISPLTVQTNAGSYLVSWSLVFGNPVYYLVSTPAVSGGAPAQTITNQYQYNSGVLPVGTHEITVRPVCNLGGTYYLGQPQTTIITVGACVPVTAPVQTLPNAVVGEPYSASIALSGTQPHTLSNVNKPSWMTVALVGATVNHTGTPGGGDSGINIPVSWDVENCGSGSPVSFNDTINVFDGEPEKNSVIHNQTGTNSSVVHVYIKILGSLDMLVEWQPLNTGSSIDFYSDDYTNVKVTVGIEDVTPAGATLVSNGNTYYGVIDGNSVAFFNVDITNGMEITLT